MVWTARELSTATYSSTESNDIVAEIIRGRVDSILVTHRSQTREDAAAAVYLPPI